MGLALKGWTWWTTKTRGSCYRSSHGSISLRPIGVVVESELTEDGPHIDDVSKAMGKIQLLERYAPGLEGLEGEERIDVLFWLDRVTEDERQAVKDKRSRGGHGEKGVFARRRPKRPNPIGITRVELVSIEGRILEVRGLDAYPGTPVLDIKPARDQIRSGARIA